MLVSYLLSESDQPPEPINAAQMNFSRKLKFLLRDLIYPGLDLHTRNRASLCGFWKTGARDVLDAGSGNGYFSWLAYRSGAKVLALNFEPSQVEKAQAYFLEHRKADPARLCFTRRNLYDLRTEERTFDEIICYETLEHVKDDTEVLTQFYRILRPGVFCTYVVLTGCIPAIKAKCSISPKQEGMFAQDTP